MKNELVAKASRLFSNVSLSLKKHSPEILVTAGVVGTVIGTVAACKATTKAGEITNEFKRQINEIHSVKEKGVEGYTEEDYKKDLTIVYSQTGIKLIKLYAPAIIISGLSIASILTGHRILKKRNMAIAAAYTAVDGAFKRYRKNAVERFGEEVDKELRYGIKAEEVEVEGKKKKETVYTVDEKLNQYSDYAKFFDETCDDFDKKNREYNLTFLKMQQNWANEKLKAKGHLFLNEVYDSLGIPRTQAGQQVGWVYNPDSPLCHNYVDFGIYTNRENNRKFVNGYEKAILLDFNVDGIIYNILETV